METLESLIARSQGGDIVAYGEIVRRFQDMAYGSAYAVLGDFHLAEDAAQEAFIEAYRKLSGLREPSAFPGWFRRIVFKHCDRFTRRARPSITPLDAAPAVASTQPGPAEVAEKREMRDQVLEAISALPEAERTATTLFYINGYSVNDIAEFLEVPAGTVKRRLHTSRGKLRERTIAMVEDALKSNVPDPEEFEDRVSFLFRTAQLLEEGVRVLDIIGRVGREARTEAVRSTAQRLLNSITEGSSISEALAKHDDLFPQMVISLIDMGERLGMVDVTMRMAGE
jgi:RNA polymerase sigma factor (sigma-70 family)